MKKYDFSNLDPVKNRRRNMCVDISLLIGFTIIIIIIYNMR